MVLGGIVYAADFPTKPVTIIVSAKPGGRFDLTARIAAAGWEKELGQPITFAYIPGASTMIAQSRMMNLPADGYTVLVTSILMHGMAVATSEENEKMCGWDKVAFVGNVIADPDVLMVHKDSQWKHAKDWIEYAKKSEKTLSISTPYPYSVGQLATNVLIRKTGINAKGVPMNSGSRSRNALAGKHVDACIGPYCSASVKKEFIRGIGSFTKEKAYPGIWDMPTMTEAVGEPIPALYDSYCIMIKEETLETAPDAYKKLVETLKRAL
jgi:tripartite-type tricarboxylate transporter receptor subunit TctC